MPGQIIANILTIIALHFLFNGKSENAWSELQDWWSADNTDVNYDGVVVAPEGEGRLGGDDGHSKTAAATTSKMLSSSAFFGSRGVKVAPDPNGLNEGAMNTELRQMGLM